MSSIIVLDTTPLGLLTQEPGKSAMVNDCIDWLTSLIDAGYRIVVPEIADYEVRRELLRAGKTNGLKRLDAFNIQKADRYLPLTTSAIRLAAELWAKLRNAGTPAADIHAIDGDAILAAQALTLGVPAAEIIVATSNVKHFAKIISADLWTNIKP